jgi:outer membrane murein-binding lipoprotein Lpp
MRPGLVAMVGVVALVGCSPAASHTQVSKEVAVRTSLAEVQSLERDQARLANQPLVTGFTVARAYRTTHTASVTDARGNVVTIGTPPAEAWVIEFTAPPQGIWSSISALQVVDISSGVAVGGGLWMVPAGAAVKSG